MCVYYLYDKINSSLHPLSITPLSLSTSPSSLYYVYSYYIVRLGGEEEGGHDKYMERELSLQYTVILIIQTVCTLSTLSHTNSMLHNSLYILSLVDNSIYYVACSLCLSIYCL